MARGKQTCKILKEIRRQIAEANGIEFVTSECRYKGDCLGTCPKCEAEVLYLEQQLHARSLAGKAIALAGISAGMFIMSGCSGTTSKNQSSYTLQGEPVASVEQIETMDTIEEGELPEIEDTVVIKKGEIDDTTYTKKTVGEIIDPEQKDKLYEAIVDVRPTFPGGDKKLMEWISQHIQYPQDAYDSLIQGRVIVQFLVKKDGSVGDAKVIKSIHRSLDMEALRVIKSLPKFNPAILNGRAVEHWFTVPVLFRLQGPDEPILDNVSDTIFPVTDKFPTFPGGMEKLMQFMASNLKYPDNWQETCINGKIIVRLNVEKSGHVSHCEIIRNSLPEEYSADAQKEVLRIIRLLPDFIPAQKGGQPVPSYFILPLSFKLSDYYDSNIVSQQVEYADLKGCVKGEYTNPDGSISREILIAAFIKNLNSNATTSSDIDGNFSIPVCRGDSILIKYIGYNNKTITIDAPSQPITITLDDKGVVLLGEVATVTTTWVENHYLDLNIIDEDGNTIDINDIDICRIWIDEDGDEDWAHIHPYTVDDNHPCRIYWDISHGLKDYDGNPLKKATLRIEAEGYDDPITIKVKYPKRNAKKTIKFKHKKT